MTKRLGTDACVALNTSGDDSAPTWTPLIAARDIKVMRSPGAVFDSSDRASLFNTKIPTRFAPSIEFDAIWNKGAGLTSLRDAFVAGTPVFAAYLAGPPGASNKGMAGDWCVCGFPLEFPLLDGQKVKIQLKPHGNNANAFSIDYTDGGAAGTAETAVAKRVGTVASINAGTTPITAAQDVKLNLEPGAMFDSSDRLAMTTHYINTVIPTRFNVSAEFSFLWNTANAQLTNIVTKLLAGDPMEMYILDGPYATTGSWGMYGDWCVAEDTEDAPLLDGQKYTIKLELHGNGTHSPAFFTKP